MLILMINMFINHSYALMMIATSLVTNPALVSAVSRSQSLQVSGKASCLLTVLSRSDTRESLYDVEVHGLMHASGWSQTSWLCAVRIDLVILACCASFYFVACDQTYTTQ